jgi:hypothetical protein
VRCAAEDVQLFRLTCFQAETEVNDLDLLRSGVHEDVVKLQIAVNVSFVVHVRDGFHKLTEDVTAGVFGKTLAGLLLDVMVDAHALAELHDQVHVCALVDHFVKLHDVWMPQFRQGVDLSVYRHLRFLFLKILLIVGLEGDRVLALLVDGPANDCECSLAYLERDLELFQVEGLVIRLILASVINDRAEFSQPLLFFLSYILLNFSFLNGFEFAFSFELI